MKLRELYSTFRQDPVTRLGLFGLSLWMFLIGVWISWPFEAFLPTLTDTSTLTNNIPEEVIAIIFMSLGGTGVLSVLKNAYRLMEWSALLLASWSVFVVSFYLLSFWESINVITYSCTAILASALFLSLVKNQD